MQWDEEYGKLEANGRSEVTKILASWELVRPTGKSIVAEMRGVSFRGKSILSSAFYPHINSEVSLDFDNICRNRNSSGL